MDKTFIKKEFGICEEILSLVEECEKEVKPYFERIEQNAEINQMKVLKAFSKNRVSEAHFTDTTGYAHSDLGRDTLCEIFADVFECEDALVRHNFISGTHTLSTMLFGVLRPGDLLLAITGKPYDTLEEVIGIAGEEGMGSLKDFGISYCEISLLSDGEPDFPKIKKALEKDFVKAVMIQRSKGYSDRPTYSTEKIGELIKFVKDISPNTLCLVDNCYGEFVQKHEPTYYGADLMAGSLIKNAGGGLCLTGGYIAGKSKYVEMCACRLSSVGIGREGGASLGVNRSLYQGFFMAPHTVSQALKSAVLSSAIFKKLGYQVSPQPEDERYDIIQDIRFGKPEPIIAFCKGVQKGAPVDSFVSPEPWDMPGYQSPVIMAAGSFIHGASIEFSADAPLREPYIVYMQGGLTYESAKYGIMMALQELKNNNLI